MIMDSGDPRLMNPILFGPGWNPQKWFRLPLPTSQWMDCQAFSSRITLIIARRVGILSMGISMAEPVHRSFVSWRPWGLHLPWLFLPEVSGFRRLYHWIGLDWKLLFGTILMVDFAGWMPIHWHRPHLWAGPEFHVLNLMLAKATTLRIASLPFQGVIWILCGPIRLIIAFVSCQSHSDSFFCWPVYSPFSLVKAPFLSTKTSLFAGKTRYWAGGVSWLGWLVGLPHPIRATSRPFGSCAWWWPPLWVRQLGPAGKPPGLSVRPPFPSLWWSFGLVKLE